jgi:hypothetical protein
MQAAKLRDGRLEERRRLVYPGAGCERVQPAKFCSHLVEGRDNGSLVCNINSNRQMIARNVARGIDIAIQAGNLPTVRRHEPCGSRPNSATRSCDGYAHSLSFGSTPQRVPHRDTETGEADGANANRPTSWRHPRAVVGIEKNKRCHALSRRSGGLVARPLDWLRP